MSYYIVTNMTDSDVLLEDIGVRLSGRGASASVGKAEFESSASVRAATRSISARIVGPVPPVWPFSAPRRPAPPSPPPPAAAPPAAPAPPADHMAALAALTARLDRLMSSVEPAIARLGQAPAQPSASSAVTAGPSPRAAQVAPADPIFIPSSIVPSGADARVKLDTTTSDGSGVDESADALRKLRRGSK
jgi:hypothetical protein